MLKLDFKFKLNVSTTDNLRDYLLINITDKLLFRSEKLSFLDIEYLIWPLSRQLPDPENEY